MKTALRAGFLFVLTLAAGLTWRAVRAERAAVVALAVMAQKASSTAATIHTVEARLAAARNENGALRAELSGAKSSGAKAARSQPRISIEELQQKILASRATADSSAEQLRELAMNRARLMPNYQQFFAKHGLSPVQIERFIAINQKRYAANMDVFALVKQGVVSADDPVVEKLRADIESEENAAYRELLGDAGFDDLREILRTAVATNLVKSFTGMATIHAAPLTRDRLDQLVRIVANADSGYRAGGHVSSSLDTIDWDQVDAQARPLLTDAQWQIFKNLDSPLGPSWAESRALGAITKAKLADAATAGESRIK